MKKSLSIISAIVLALNLTACSKPETSGENSSGNSSGVSEPVSDVKTSGNSSDVSEPVSDVKTSGNSSDVSEPVSGDNSSESSSSDAPTPAGNEITAQFETPNGEPVDLTNAVVNGYEGEISLSEMTKDNWSYVMCEYVYLAEPQGIYYDSVKNADIFNKNEMTFTGAPETVSYKYKKYKVGDSFGELKVTDAKTSFFSDLSAMKPKYFNGGSVYFEGKLTLTGKCRLAPETEGYVTARDIAFVPDANSCKLPIMDYFSDENGKVPLCAGMTNGVCWLSEYPAGISLGNADGYPDFDFSEFPENGSFVDVQVTIDKILLRNELNFTNTFNAKLVDIKLV